MDGPLGESKYIQSGNFTDQGPIFTHDVPFDNVSSGSIAFTLAKLEKRRYVYEDFVFIIIQKTAP